MGPPGVPSAPAQAYPQTSNNAVVALILAIISFVVCPVVCAIVALVFASKASKEIKASNGWLTGDGLVLSAKILAWVNIALTILGVIIFLIIVIVAANSPDFAPTPTPSYSF